MHMVRGKRSPLPGVVVGTAISSILAWVTEAGRAEPAVACGVVFSVFVVFGMAFGRR